MRKTIFIILSVLGICAFISCNFFQRSEYEVNVIPVSDGEHWGYINKDGKYVINPQFHKLVPLWMDWHGCKMRMVK